MLVSDWSALREHDWGLELPLEGFLLAFKRLSFSFFLAREMIVMLHLSLLQLSECILCDISYLSFLLLQTLTSDLGSAWWESSVKLGVLRPVEVSWLS